MSYNSNLAMYFDTFAVAMRAIAGDLEQSDVDNLVTRADELLVRGDPLGRAITGFATQHQLAAQDPEALAGLGRDLVHAVAVASMPVPPDGERRDING